MDTTIQPRQKKTGRKPLGLGKQQIHVLVPEQLKEWVDCHPEGTSPLIRRLLREEYERQQQRLSPP